MSAQTLAPPPLTPAFASCLRRSLFLQAGVLLVTFYFMSDGLVRAIHGEQLIRRAHLCAAALTPDANGDLTGAVARLQERDEELVAVAVLHPSGRIDRVIPDRPAHRRAALNLLASGVDRVLLDASEGGDAVPVSGVMVSLDGGPSPLAPSAIILLRYSHPRGSAKATALFALVLVISGLTAARSAKGWIDREVAGPLCSIAGTLQAPTDRSEPSPVITGGALRETTEIAEGVRELLQSTVEAQVRARRIQRAADDQLRTRERGFHSQLRRVLNQAATDPLTKLRNRSFLEEELEPLFERLVKSGADLTAVMIDLDNFKQYNDARGHRFGDALLKFLGTLLHGSIRSEDLAVRYGGDEFLLLLSKTSAEQARRVTERIVKLFGQYTMRLGKDHNLSMSAGLASLHTDQPESGQDLVAKADGALYLAKRNGKNAVALCSQN